MTNKEKVAAFYRELYEGKKGTKEYARQAMARSGTILQQFRWKNKSFPGPVQDAWEFFSYYGELNYFPKRKQKFERLSDDMLVGKIDKEFIVFLKAEQYKVRPLVDPKEMPEPEPDLSVFDVPPSHEVKAHKVAGGNYSLDGQRADHQYDKTILDFRTPTEDEETRDRRELKEEVRLLQLFVRRWSSGRRKNDPVCQFGLEFLKRRLKEEVEREDDPDLFLGRKLPAGLTLDLPDNRFR